MPESPVLIRLARHQWRTIPPVRTSDLTGKTVVVLGANTGIGFEAAKHFASMNPGQLILGCRSKEKGEAALSRIKSATGYHGAELWLIDLAKFSSVKAFADRFLQGGRLDYLILNAAIATEDYSSTEDGWESSIQVNCIAPSLLALLLLPRMIETAQKYSVTPRIVVVSSGTHTWTTFDEQILGSQEPLRVLGSKEYCTNQTMDRRYPDTKLINLLFVRSLSERLKGVPVIVNAVDPGYCVSELRRNVNFGFRRFVFWVMDLLLAWTAEQGSRNLLFAALAGSDGEESEETLRGAYVSTFDVAKPSDFVFSVQGKDVQERIWKETLGILGELDARVPVIASKHLS